MQYKIASPASHTIGVEDMRTGTRALGGTMTVLFKMRYCTTFAPLFLFKSNSIDAVYRAGTNTPLMFLFAHREGVRTTPELFI